MISLMLIGYIAGAFGLIATIAAAFVIAKSTTAKTTIDSQKELINTLMAGKQEQKDQIADLQNKHNESNQAIAELRGQVNVLRDVPLKQISDDMHAIAGRMSTISENQATITSILQASTVAGSAAKN